MKKILKSALFLLPFVAWSSTTPINNPVVTGASGLVGVGGQDLSISAPQDGTGNYNILLKPDDTMGHVKIIGRALDGISELDFMDHANTNPRGFISGGNTSSGSVLSFGAAGTFSVQLTFDANANLNFTVGTQQNKITGLKAAIASGVNELAFAAATDGVLSNTTNVASFQNTAAAGAEPSAIRFMDYQGNEVQAIGYGNNNGGVGSWSYQSNFIENSWPAFNTTPANQPAPTWKFVNTGYYSGSNTFFEVLTVGSNGQFYVFNQTLGSTNPTVNLYSDGAGHIEIGNTTSVSSDPLTVTGTGITGTNGSGSFDYKAERSATSTGATFQWFTGSTLEWYAGLRGLTNNNWYLFNNNTSSNSIVVDDVTNLITTQGGITTTTIGTTLSVKSGSNSKAGTFTLTSGSVTVANTSVDASSVIQVTVKTVSGTRAGNPDIVPTAGTGFVATAVGTDNSTYNYIIFEVN